VFLLTVLGYELGSVPLVRRYFDIVILLIIFVSLLPTIIEVIRGLREHRAKGARQG
jgi:membrane-associated protein